MFSRLAGNQVVAAPNARGFATAQQLGLRIRSVKNIKKITSAMKMVAACKLRKSQEALERGRALNKMTKYWPESFVPEGTTKYLTVGISGDKGLCGGVNSSIVRATRDHMNALPEGSEQSLVVYGEKAKQGLERLFVNELTTTCADNGKLVPLEFNQSLEIADFMTNANYESMSVFYQLFRSMISYDTTKVDYVGWEAQAKDLSFFNDYEIEGDSDCLKNLWEFRHAVSLHCMFAENDTSTLSSRMAAMDNSTKNAGEMIDKLTIILNRNRQAKITTELTEIISGAAAVEEG
jgi:F-type H+-transporting ATPase subunit gamma